MTTISQYYDNLKEERLKTLSSTNPEIVQFVNLVKGKSKITIVSNIFSHDVCGRFPLIMDKYGDVIEDVYDIKARKGSKEIKEEIVFALENMKMQFDHICEDRSYFFEGITYDEKTQRYRILWGS